MVEKRVGATAIEEAKGIYVCLLAIEGLDQDGSFR